MTPTRANRPARAGPAPRSGVWARSPRATERPSDLERVRRYERFGPAAATEITTAQIATFAQLTPGQFDLLYQRAFNPTSSWRGRLHSAVRLLLRCAQAVGRYMSQPGVGEALIVSTGCGYVLMLHPYDLDTPTDRER